VQCTSSICRSLTRVVIVRVREPGTHNPRPLYYILSMVFYRISVVVAKRKEKNIRRIRVKCLRQMAPLRCVFERVFRNSRLIRYSWKRFVSRGSQWNRNYDIITDTRTHTHYLCTQWSFYVGTPNIYRRLIGETTLYRSAWALVGGRCRDKLHCLHAGAVIIYNIIMVNIMNHIYCV